MSIVRKCQHCKAHPDEKGIETKKLHLLCPLHNLNCKAHPDEKGIETILGCWQIGHCISPNCKAHPDEKGIETNHLIHLYL